MNNLVGLIAVGEGNHVDGALDSAPQVQGVSGGLLHHGMFIKLN
jgi:hypothetical protein